MGKECRSDRFGGQQTTALAGVSFDLDQGEYVAVMGKSGSGKTTLLNILAALDKPTSGQVILGGMDLTEVFPAAGHGYDAHCCGI